MCRKRERKERREKRICPVSVKNLDQKCTKNLDQNLDQNVPKITTKKAALFSRQKEDFTAAVEYYISTYIIIQKSNTNGRKQKRDADFTETATEKKTFMLCSLVFDFGSARVEKSIA